MQQFYQRFDVNGDLVWYNADVDASMFYFDVWMIDYHQSGIMVEAETSISENIPHDGNYFLLNQDTGEYSNYYLEFTLINTCAGTNFKKVPYFKLY